MSIGFDTTSCDSDCQVFVMISRDHAFTASCTLLHLRSHEGSFLPLKLFLTNTIHDVQLHKETEGRTDQRNAQINFSLISLN